MGVIGDVDPNLLTDPALAAQPPVAQPPPPVAAAPMAAPGVAGPSPALAAAVAAGKPIVDTKNVSTTTPKLAPEQKQDLKTVDELRTKEASAIDSETIEKQKAAAAERKAQDDAIRAAEVAQAAKSEAIAQAQQRRAAAEAEYQRKFEEFNGQQFHSLWSSRSKAGEVLADIGVTLGAFGSSGRGQNEAADILRARIADDFNDQRANIENAKDRVVMAKARVADADEARRILIDDIDIKNAAALAAVKQRLDAAKMPTDLGIAAQGEKAKADIAKDLLALRQKTTDSLTQRTTSSTNFLNPEALELKQGAKAQKPGQDLTVEDPETGQVIKAKSTRDLTLVKNTLVEAANARKAVQDLQAFHEAHPGRQLGAFGYGTPEYEQLHKLRELATQALSRLQGTTGSDTKFKSDMRTLPSAGDLTSFNQDPTAAIDALYKTIDNRKTAVIRASGAEPVGTPVKPIVQSPVPAEKPGAAAAPKGAPAPLSKDERSYLRAQQAKGGPEGELASKILAAAGQ